MIAKNYKSTFTGELVKYYDKFFIEERPKEKSIANEVEYVLNRLKEYGFNMENLLDVGCGTGYHSQLISERISRVEGCDISEDMIAYAKENHKTGNNHFTVKDITKECYAETFSGVISLSHVIGYQYDNENVEKMLSNINRSLQLGGGIRI